MSQPTAKMSDRPLVRRRPPGVLEPGRPRKGRARRSRGPTKRVRIAVEAMVREGLDRKAAAERAGLTDDALYRSLRLPATKQLYAEELEALRISERARGVHVAAKIRDDDELGATPAGATARLKAIGTIEGRSDSPNVAIQINNNNQVEAQQPGYVVAIPEKFARQIEAEQRASQRIEHEHEETPDAVE